MADFKPHTGVYFSMKNPSKTVYF